jgi:hypothetical protein
MTLLARILFQVVPLDLDDYQHLRVPVIQLRAQVDASAPASDKPPRLLPERACKAVAES